VEAERLSKKGRTTAALAAMRLPELKPSCFALCCVKKIYGQFAVRIFHNPDFEIDVEVFRLSLADQLEMIIPAEDIGRVFLDDLHPFTPQDVLSVAYQSITIAFPVNIEERSHMISTFNAMYLETGCASEIDFFAITISTRADHGFLKWERELF
jgi:hypothetical protein